MPANVAKTSAKTRATTTRCNCNCGAGKHHPTSSRSDNCSMRPRACRNPVDDARGVVTENAQRYRRKSSLDPPIHKYQVT